jgi:hypothetical protein
LAYEDEGGENIQEVIFWTPYGFVVYFLVFSDASKTWGAFCALFTGRVELKYLTSTIEAFRFSWL